MPTTLCFTKSASKALAVLSVGALFALQPAVSSAVDLQPLRDDPQTQAGADFGQLNGFADAPAFFLDQTGTLGGNNFSVYTMDGTTGSGGAGLTVFASNGENGITSTEGGANPDIDNEQPVNPAIAALNNSGKLENGNVIRFSAWMRQDPNDPVTAVPQIEPVLKIELWKEAKSGFADFEPPDFPRFGDRIWDTDQNAGKSLFDGADQSQADWVDMNNSGTTSFGNPVSQSLVTDEWRLVETELVIDDDPLDDGFGWGIGADLFTVADVEEIRGVLFFGDFASTDLTDAGSIWVDNVLLEIFADEASVTPNTNPMPVEAAGLSGDFNNDGTVDAADYTLWRDNLGAADESSINNLGDGNNGVDSADYALWKGNFGMTAGGGSGSAIPEPASASMVLLAGIALSLRRRG